MSAFVEKPHGDGSWINGGFFVLSPEVGEYIDGDATVWEQEPLERLADDGQLSAYRYDGFWQMMDTAARQEPPGGALGHVTPPWKSW